MASIFPGFEYEIFIGYRQKDNKGDRWVTEFVNSLKTELEATFKDNEFKFYLQTMMNRNILTLDFNSHTIKHLERLLNQIDQEIIKLE